LVEGPLVPPVEASRTRSPIILHHIHCMACIWLLIVYCVIL